MPDEQTAPGNPGEDLNALVTALKATQTHWPPAPNPVPGYVDGALSFAQGGLQGLANQQGWQTPEWSKRVGAALSSPEANATLGALKLTPRFSLPGGTRGYELRN